MELRQYWAVLRRRLPLVAAIVGLTALLSLALLVTARPTYSAFTRLAIRQRPLPSVAQPPGTPVAYSYENYYNFYSSEFLADDLAIIVTSRAFAEMVGARLGGGGLPGSFATDRKQRELTIIANSADPVAAARMGIAAAEVFTELSKPGATLPALNGVSIPHDALFAVIDRPANDNDAAANRSRQLINALIPVGVGLALALALAFLLEQLDPRLRDLEDAAASTGLPVLGTIPKGK